MSRVVTIKAALEWGRSQLLPLQSSSDGVIDAAIDTRLLLSFLLDKPLTYLLTWPKKTIEPEIWAGFQQLIERRAKGEPVAYLTGLRDFWTLTLKVSPHTLIPRADTELVIEQALQRLTDQCATVLDLGSGTGAIALSIAAERPRVTVIGVDRIDEAVALAQENAQFNQIDNAEFRCGSWFEPVTGQKFDMIVSNPPYIAMNDPHLSCGDLRFEPHSALVSEQDGLADIRDIIAKAPEFLVPGGWLLIEHGHEQGEALRALFADAGFGQIETVADYGGNERVTLGAISE